MNPIEAALFNLLYVVSVDTKADPEVREIARQAYEDMQRWIMREE